MASQLKGSRRVTKFMGGYKDPYPYNARNLKPDTRLPGRWCIPIDYEHWTDMDAMEANRKKFVAISYKHDLRYPTPWKPEEPKEGEPPETRVHDCHCGNYVPGVNDQQRLCDDTCQTYRAMRAPPVVVDEVLLSMQELNIKNYWHDGGFPLWKGERPNCRGSYPYLLDGGKVVIVPPFCNQNIIDVRSWCPSDYVYAARGMLVMSRYKIVEKKGQRFLKRRRKAGVPSVAWGDSNRVWLLAEAFCAAIRGEAYLSPRSRRRLFTFVDELNFVREGLELFQFRKSRKKPYSTVDGTDWIYYALKELKILRDEVLEYIEIMTNKEVRKDGFKLSHYFVERMATAGSSYESDRVLLGAVTTFLLEQKFGMEVSPQDALAELENSDDPFVTALTLSSVGNHSFPLGMTRAQAINNLELAALRSDVQEHIDLNMGSILNQWPQPQTGRCYAGTLTNSAWKNHFLGALHDGRCMLVERKLEKIIRDSATDRETQFLQSEDFRNAMEKHQRYRWRRILFAPGGSFSEPTMNHPLVQLFTTYDASKMPEIPRDMLQSQDKFNEAYEVRESGIRDLKALWADRQKRYKVVVSGAMPVAISPDRCHYIVYVMDTYGLRGIFLEAAEALTSSGEALLVIEKGNQTFELSKSYQGRQIQYDIHLTPLLQVLVCADRGHLVAMRRVWSLNANSRVSIAPSKLKLIDSKRVAIDVFKNGNLFQLDRCIPVSLYESKMKEFAPKYSVISTTHGVAVTPKSARNVVEDPPEIIWPKIMQAIYSPWAPDGEFDTESASRSGKKVKSNPSSPRKASPKDDSTSPTDSSFDELDC